jgi:hypothetical protein
MDHMQINRTNNPASAGPRDARHAEASQHSLIRRRPTLSRREVRRIVAEMIG